MFGLEASGRAIGLHMVGDEGDDNWKITATGRGELPSSTTLASNHASIDIKRHLGISRGEAAINDKTCPVNEGCFRTRQKDDG
jgi:hypothetical protein